MKSLLLLALGLARTVVLGARIEAERIVVSVRPYKREQRRCPVCGRACDFYDMANRGAPRLWRAMDLARSACYLEYAPCRVRCPEHGVRTEAVPWARHGARFTRDFEDWVAWLAVRCTASAVSELARVEWHGVGGVCRRVYAELEAARGASRFDGVRLFFTTTKFRISRLISFGFHRFAKVPHPFFANCPIFPSSRLPRTFCSARRTQPADHDA